MQLEKVGTSKMPKHGDASKLFLIELCHNGLKSSQIKSLGVFYYYFYFIFFASATPVHDFSAPATHSHDQCD